jgi:Fe2+ or Zn2+ uptake regulation protein
MNQVTVYRSLDALYKAQIVKRVNLEHDHAHFELAAGREHHHHAVCRNCGYIENIEIPHAAKPELEALKQTKGFSMLDSYSLEFFGLCKKCAKLSKVNLR